MTLRSIGQKWIRFDNPAVVSELTKEETLQQSACQGKIIAYGCAIAANGGVMRLLALLVLVALAPDSVAAVHAQEIAALCDRLASDPEDAEATAAGVMTRDLVQPTARDACERAAMAAPRDRRILYQHGRTLERYSTRQAFSQYYNAYKLGHVQSAQGMIDLFAADQSIATPCLIKELSDFQMAQAGNVFNTHANRAMLLANGTCITKDLTAAQQHVNRAMRLANNDTDRRFINRLNADLSRDIANELANGLLNSMAKETRERATGPCTWSWVVASNQGIRHCSQLY